MDLLTCLVRTSRAAELLQLLRNYSGITSAIRELELPCQAGEIINSRDQPPSSYLINRNGDWWIIEVNSLMPLRELGHRISDTLDCEFLQMLYVDAVEYAYFLLYRSGELIREIEGRGDLEWPSVNKGTWMPEGWGEAVRYFDLDTIHELAAGLGIDISNLFTDAECLLLDSGTHPDMIRLDDQAGLQTLLQPG